MQSCQLTLAGHTELTIIEPYGKSAVRLTFANIPTKPGFLSIHLEALLQTIPRNK